MFHTHFSDIGGPRAGWPRAVGAYIFAGGHTIGVGQHFSVLAQLEDGPFGVATTRKNMPKLPVHTDPGTWLTFLAEHGADRDIDWIYGNPPCAPFSVAGHNAKTKRRKEDEWYKKDPRTSCIHKQFFLLETVQPKVWTWESVCPAFTKGRDLVDALTDRALALGYSATYLFDNALDLGVAQRRLRMFCVFHKIEIPWRYPKRDPKEYVTVGQAWQEAFGDRNGFPGGEIAHISKRGIEYINDTLPGESMRRAWERKRNWSPEVEANWPRSKQGLEGRPGFSAIRQSLDLPSPTLLGGATAFHPTEPRHLSVKEQQVLCSYPPDYEFIGSTGDQYSQMGKAVMPKVGEWLASNIRRAVDQNKPTSGVVRKVDFIHSKYLVMRPETSVMCGHELPITYNADTVTTFAT